MANPTGTTYLTENTGYVWRQAQRSGAEQASLRVAHSERSERVRITPAKPSVTWRRD